MIVFADEASPDVPTVSAKSSKACICGGLRIRLCHGFNVSWAVAKLYTSHDELEGVRFRDQKQIENQKDMTIVVRDLADIFYEKPSDDVDVKSREEPSSGLVVPDDWPEDAEQKTLDEL
ncbi:hypothetical protein [Haloarcula sp. 1CSR25-25]|uniref:hypothetical protein n=1 Tax=Haloarcula sp. 1CSR25-25 TaxID=2862545 RepID=UPI0028939225|nr:hypothetical protein [Haloarcula sp. 1CSR25-25]MDT3434251.1 hypothetical protein [Haloarcula sp. 1CSR25-25]